MSLYDVLTPLLSNTVSCGFGGMPSHVGASVLGQATSLHTVVVDLIHSETVIFKVWGPSVELLYPRVYFGIV